jgi:formiminotetrahydrofolate cyclodeaminase
MSLGPLPLEAYLDRLASTAPAPGGGTAAAIAGATGAALAEMVLGLTLGREKYASVQARLEPLLPDARALRDEFLRLADEDARAYEAFVRAGKLPKASPEEQAARKAAMQHAALGAAEVPLRTARAAVEALRVLAPIAKLGNPNARSDAIVGAWHAHAAYQGARLNVLANLDGIGDAAKAAQLRAEVEALGKDAEAFLAEARSAA